jgi:hypothetical protein
MQRPVLLEVNRASLRRQCTEIHRRIARGQEVFALDLTLRGGEPVPIRRVHLGHAHAILCVPRNGAVFWAIEFFDADGRRINGSEPGETNSWHTSSAFDEQASKAGSYGHDRRQSSGKYPRATDLGRL